MGTLSRMTNIGHITKFPHHSLRHDTQQRSPTRIRNRNPMASKLASINPPPQADEIFFVLPFTYTLDLWLIKYALLAFYNRIFVQPQLRRYILVTAIIL